MLYEMQSRFLQEWWANSVGVAMRYTVDVAEQTGDVIDSAQNRQLDGIKDCLLGSTRQAGKTWDSWYQLMYKRTARHKHVALVTGGTGGIGTAICKKLIEAGNRVVATHIPSDKKIAQKWQTELLCDGLDVQIIECDVSSFDSCATMAREIERRWRSVDVLVNCAGITRDNTLRKMDEEHWHEVLDTNLDSVFNVTKNVIDSMVERNYGRIINISSVNGQKGQFGQTNYSAAKAGMIGFTKSLARELADHGITVNTVSPGYVATSMVMGVAEEIRDAIVAQIPIGRLGEPKEIAQAVAFLAADESGYITGTDIAVNGGLYMA